MTSNPRIAILPKEIVSEVITASVARGGWLVAGVLVVLDVPVLIDVLSARGLASALPVPLAALAGMLVLLGFFGWRPTARARLIYVAASSVCVVVYTVALLQADPTLPGDATYLVNRPAVALVLLGPVVMRPVFGLLWSVAGLALSLVLIAISCLLAHVPFFSGWGPFTTWAVFAIAYLVLSLVRANQTAAVPDLARLEAETRRMDVENQFEQRAAALIHDTVLGDLAAVMNSTGDLDDRARERFRVDVATLKNPHWLRDSERELAGDDRDAVLRNGSVALASEMQWRGLTVDLTGENDAIVRLSPAATGAIHDALRACLENVLQHSGVTLALLVAGGSEDEITYMVIDHGVGFDVDAVPADRLGLRQSVVGRIAAHGGSVRVWSQPGSGTSVLISMPIGSASSPMGDR